MNPIVPLVIVFILIVLLDAIPKIGKILRNVFLLVFFLFMVANTDLQGATFYSIMAVSILVFAVIFMFIKGGKDAAQNIVDPQSMNLADYKVKGKMISIISFVAGIILFIIMQFIQSNQPSAIVGVPTLAVASVGVKATISAALGVAFIAALGIIENTFFFYLFEFVKLVMPALSILPIVGAAFVTPFFILLIPLLLISAAFALFHAVAFGLATSMMIWAFAIFALWSVSYMFIGESASSYAHYFWNASVALSRTLSIAK